MTKIIIRTIKEFNDISNRKEITYYQANNTTWFNRPLLESEKIYLTDSPNNFVEVLIKDNSTIFIKNRRVKVISIQDSKLPHLVRTYTFFIGDLKIKDSTHKHSERERITLKVLRKNIK